MNIYTPERDRNESENFLQDLFLFRLIWCHHHTWLPADSPILLVASPHECLKGRHSSCPSARRGLGNRAVNMA